MKSLIGALMAGLLTIGLIAQDIPDVKVIMLGIGAKNATFDETRFPHLSFFYTPELISQAQLDGTEKSALSLLAGDATREVFEGKPELLAKWWDETDIRSHAILFDKNGVGTWQGWIDRKDELMDSRGYGDEEELEDAFEFLFEDEEVTELDADKEFDYEDNDCLIESKIPDFEVTSVSGEKKSIKNMVEDGKATLLVFFQIPSDVDLVAAKKEVKKEDGLSGFLGGLTQTVAGEEWEQTIIKIENQLFQYKIEE